MVFWDWVEEDIENRAWYLATFVPPALFHSEDEICFARELLVRYGDQEDVLDNFSANYSTETWAGSGGEHCIDKKEYLLEFKEKETNSSIEDLSAGMDRKIQYLSESFHVGSGQIFYEAIGFRKIFAFYLQIWSP